MIASATSHAFIRRRAAVSLVALALLASCSRDHSDTPTAPRVYSISGHVVLKGYFVDDAAQVVGTRVIGDADGVGVELLYGSQVVATTTTVGGVYTFTGLRVGAYSAHARVTDAVEDETFPLIIASRDVASADTLKLSAAGDLVPVPNPFTVELTTFFDVSVAGPVVVTVVDLAGNNVATLFDGNFGPGPHSLVWTGYDEHGQPAVDPMYWLVYEGPDGTRAHLVFRTLAVPLQSP